MVFSGPLPPDDTEADRDLRQGLQDASPETLKAFVLLAALLQVGLFVGSLGVMLFVFRNQRALGGTLVVGGLFALALTAVLYRKRRRST